MFFFHWFFCMKVKGHEYSNALYCSCLKISCYPKRSRRSLRVEGKMVLLSYLFLLIKGWLVLKGFVQYIFLFKSEREHFFLFRLTFFSLLKYSYFRNLESQIFWNHQMFEGDIYYILINNLVNNWYNLFSYSFHSTENNLI